MAAVTMKQLLEAGVHFGHQTRRWNPKMRPYIYGERNGIHIIDLRQTLAQVERAYEFVRDVVAGGGIVLFVGTKKQAQAAIAESAEAVEMPYVNFRWLGGMLTNFATIQKRIFYMKELGRMEASGEMEALPKKERLRLRRELGKLQRNLGGLSSLGKLPNAVFLIDLNAEQTALREANRLGIPVVAVVDTNCDPDPVDMVIPGNDDAIRSSQLLSSVMAEACREGRGVAAKRLEAAAKAEREAARAAAQAEEQAAAEAAAKEAAAAAESVPEAAAAAASAEAGVETAEKTEPAAKPRARRKKAETGAKAKSETAAAKKPGSAAEKSSETAAKPKASARRKKASPAESAAAEGSGAAAAPVGDEDGSPASAAPAEEPAS